MRLSRWSGIISGMKGTTHWSSEAARADYLASNISTAHSNIGYLLTLVINLSVLLPMQNNPFSNNLALCLTNSCKMPGTLLEVNPFTNIPFIFKTG